ncbi:uncharacterized protein LACBIDRAFT_297510 [Laccaria bicolor S238N-H82]|uniref:Predicted protein n=1 Tax=Laccaria bicolor (strain S238N-H82 / ATCC MYA-4686) TaxID=486041 RepID=B0DBC8_LACBS|nr:uncharacterized protein LACBIDRAFT_297510 [Laccaria bicolor S238N-H82]EDR07969.1 predicted protein [Laccaria bicolor S238N-H82]|eukprot:XP_001881039.1 predicted protein [Laccaria bicolor S238N-H82]
MLGPSSPSTSSTHYLPTPMSSAVIGHSTKIWELNVHWPLYSQCAVWDPRRRGVDIWECVRDHDSTPTSQCYVLEVYRAKMICAQQNLLTLVQNGMHPLVAMRSGLHLHIAPSSSSPVYLLAPWPKPPPGLSHCVQ